MSTLGTGDLIEIFQHTHALASTEYPYTDKFINFPITSKFHLKLNGKNKILPLFEVTQNDCLDDCYQLYSQYSNSKILLINSASSLRKGGGVTNGKNAQEESICRKTNLYLALEQIDHSLEYPLHNKTKGVYLPNISVFKDENHQIIPTYNVDVLNVFSRPRDKIKTEREFELIYGNIFESIVHVANTYQMDYIVIVPIGCGAFGHDPEMIAERLKYYINIYKLNTVQKIIVSCYTNDQSFDAFEYQLC